MTRRYAPLLAALLMLTAGHDAFAQGKDPAAADALFRQGREAMKNKDYATACPKFAESQRLDPAPGTLLNLAQCEEALGKTASAVQHYRDVAELLPSSDPRTSHAKGRVTALTPQVPRLTIKLAAGSPRGTEVTRSGIELGTASLGAPLPVDPGEHEIVVSAPGRKTTRQTVSLQRGESRLVTVTVGEIESPESADRTASAPAAHAKHQGPAQDGSVSPDSGSTARTTSYVLGAAGLVGLGVGTYFALKSKSQDDDALKTFDSGYCTDQRCVDLTNQARDSGKIAIGSFVAGGVLITSAAITYFATRQSDTGQTTRSARLGVGGGSTWFGAALHGRW